jgi:hypothetical protein
MDSLNITFAETVGKLQFLDNLNSALEFPPLYVSMRLEQLEPLCHHYGKITETLQTDPTADQSGIDIHTLADHLCRYIDQDALTEKALSYEWHLRDEEHPEAPEYSEKIDKTVLAGTLFLRSYLFEFVSILNNGIGIKELFYRVQADDETAFLDLVRIDKTIVTTEYAKPFILRAQYQADWEYLELVGKAIAAPPLAVRSEVPKAVILVAKFWGGHFKEMKFREIVDYLMKYDVLVKSHDYSWFRKQLYKFGLRKPRYNKK